MTTQNLILSFEKQLEETQMPAGKRKTLLAAIELFSEQGFHGTSTAQLADKAGVSQATIFKYFKTKEDLLAGILGPMIDLLGRPFLGSLADCKNKKELVHFLIQDRFAFLKANQKLFKILLQEILINPQTKKVLFNQLGAVSSELQQAFQILGQESQADPALTIRRIIAPLFTYSVKRFVLSLPSADEAADLATIEADILKVLD